MGEKLSANQTFFTDPVKSMLRIKPKVMNEFSVLLQEEKSVLSERKKIKGDFRSLTTYNIYVAFEEVFTSPTFMRIILGEEKISGRN